MRLLLADDHTLFRDALSQYIVRADSEAEVVLAKDFHEASDLMEDNPDYDLVLLDLRMPGMGDMKGLADIREKYPDVPVALMSGVAEVEDVKRAIDMGAVGYFPKTLSGKALLKAIHLVLAGGRYVPIDMDTSGIMPSYYSDQETHDNVTAFYEPEDKPDQAAESVNLTPREQDVLSHLAVGSSNKEIANELNLQEVTVKLHVRGICRKLGAKNRTQAAVKAREMGLAS